MVLRINRVRIKRSQPVVSLTLFVNIHGKLGFTESNDGKQDWLTAINWLIVQLSQVAIIEAVGAIDTTDQIENMFNEVVAMYQ